MEFESIIAKLRHAFIAIPTGVGLLSVCNPILGKRPQFVHISRNHHLLEALRDGRTILRESTVRPTPCEELVAGWPDFVGVVDASSQGVGGVIIGKLAECPQQSLGSSGLLTSQQVLSRTAIQMDH
jgi:hypothetical protein